MQDIDRMMKIRDFVEPIAFASTLFAIQFYSTDSLINILPLGLDRMVFIQFFAFCIGLLIVLRIIHKPIVRQWNYFSPIKKDNIYESISSHSLVYAISITPYINLISGYSFAKTFQTALFIFVFSLPFSLFRTQLNLKIRMHIQYNKSKKYLL